MTQDTGIYSGKRLAIRCPWCDDGWQIIRQNRLTEEFFVSCTEWPKCSFSGNLPEHIRMRAMGQRSLFDD